MQPAPYLSRVGAFIIDTIILTVMVFAVYTVLFLIGIASMDSDSSGGAFVFLVFFGWIFAVAMGLVYYGVTMTRPGFRNGQTFGKQLMNIRVVNGNGTTFSWGSVGKREVLAKMLIMGLAGGVTGGIANLIDYLWPLWDAKAQTLHDKIADTFVVDANEQVASYTGATNGKGVSSLPADLDPFGR